MSKITPEVLNCVVRGAVASVVMCLSAVSTVCAQSGGGGCTYGPQFGTHLSLDGVDDYARVDATPELPQGNAPYTIELWERLDDYLSYPGGYNGFLVSRGAEGQRNAVHIVAWNHHVGLTHYLLDRDTQVPLLLHTWTHLATTWDGTTERLYVNGALAWSELASGGLSVSGTTLTFGKHNNFATFFAAAQIDDVRVWNTARTATEIAANFAAPIAPDSPWLVGYWKFDEASGDTIIDSSPSARNGLLHNGAGRAAYTVCPGDFNCSGALDSQDFFDFLTAFFGLQPAADFNHDTFINSQDFFDFLAAFFDGC